MGVSLLEKYLGTILIPNRKICCDLLPCQGKKCCSFNVGNFLEVSHTRFQKMESKDKLKPQGVLKLNYRLLGACIRSPGSKLEMLEVYLEVSEELAKM